MNGLRAKRIAAGLSLRQLSERSGVAVETLSRIERGRSRPQVRTLAKLADALGVDPLELTKPDVLAPRKEDKHVDEPTTISVPAWIPVLGEPERFKQWDGSEDAWMWKVAADFFEDSKITAAAYFYRYTKDWSLAQQLLAESEWTRAFDDEEDAQAFVEAHKEEIERRAENMF